MIKGGTMYIHYNTRKNNIVTYRGGLSKETSPVYDIDWWAYPG